MNITLYNNQSSRVVADKTLVPVGYSSGTFRATADVLRPVFQLDVGGVPDSCNYVGITDFGRFYYVTERRMITTNIVELQLEVDVRKSFLDEFKANRGIVDRQTNNYDAYLKDEKIPIGAKKALAVRSFPQTPFEGGNSNRVVMLVLGG